VQQWSLLSTLTQRCCDITVAHSPLPRLNISVRGLKQPQPAGRKSSLGFGLGIDSKERDTCPVRFAIEPVVLLNDSRAEGVVQENRGGVWHFRGAHHEASIEEATGRLLSVVHESDEGRLQITTEASAYQRLQPELQQLAGRLSNAAPNGMQPSNVFDFLLAEVAAAASQMGNDEFADSVMGWGHLLGGQLAPRLAALFEKSDRPEEVFHIPPPADDAHMQVLWVGSMFLQANAILFPREATPAVLGRELTAALLLQDADALKSVARIGQSTKTGPLTCWYAAEVLRFVNPKLAQLFATEGLSRMESRHLRHDLTSLLDGESFVGDTLRDAVRQLREIPADDLERLFSLVEDDRTRSALLDGVRHPAGSVDHSVIRVGEVLWEAWARAAVDNRLRQLAAPAEDSDLALRSDKYPARHSRVSRQPPPVAKAGQFQKVRGGQRSVGVEIHSPSTFSARGRSAGAHGRGVFGGQAGALGDAVGVGFAAGVGDDELGQQPQ
jgi:hypothetical protein